MSFSFSIQKLKKLVRKIVNFRYNFPPKKETNANIDSSSIIIHHKYEELESIHNDFDAFILEQERLNEFKMIKFFDSNYTFIRNKNILFHKPCERTYPIQEKIAYLIFHYFNCSYLPHALLRLIEIYDVYYAVNLFLGALNFDYKILISSINEQNKFSKMVFILIEVDCLTAKTGLSTIPIYQKLKSREFDDTEELLGRLRKISVIINSVQNIEYELLETVNGLLNNIKEIIINWYTVEQIKIEDVYRQVKYLYEAQQYFNNIRFSIWNIQHAPSDIMKFRKKNKQLRKKFIDGKINLIEFNSYITSLHKELENTLGKVPFHNDEKNFFLFPMPYKEKNLQQCFHILEIDGIDNLTIDMLIQEYKKIIIKDSWRKDKKHFSDLRQAYLNLLNFFISQSSNSLCDISIL